MSRFRTSVILSLAAAAALAAAAPAAPTTATDVELSLPEQVLAAVADLGSPPRPTGWLPGEAMDVGGTVGIYEHATGRTTGRALQFELRINRDPARSTGPLIARPDGTFMATLPASATAGLAPGAHGVWVHASDLVRLGLDPDRAATPAATFVIAATDGTDVVLRHEFVSSTGWVKPGGSFPVRTIVENHTDAAQSNLTVTLSAAPSSTFTGATPLDGSGAATVQAATIVWSIPSVPAASTEGPGQVELISEMGAARLTADPRVVWKDLSSTATLTGVAAGPLTAATHGPKVIPPAGGFESARYGDKPFPIVPVQYVDRAPQPGNDPADLDRVVNDPAFDGSMFNLYQEMSYGQLFPRGVVPSADIQTATFSDEQEDGFTWTQPPLVGGTCRGATLAAVPGVIGSPLFDARIVDGWYQLPGNTEYYGGDFPAFTLGVAGAIDSACGQIGKAVYDAAAIADPEIDYNDFDSDRDGIVDFFMLVFVGCGGNGASQVPAPETPITNELCPYTDVPYDNIWPHSSSLEMQYIQEGTGLRGYVSNDQLRSLTGVPQCFIDTTHTAFDDCATDGGKGLDDSPVPVRVGPYNVNPETVFESASVISHEYGHHLDLPDFYNASGFNAYHQYNLMAADYSQHMTVFSKQELGWVVPRYLQPGDEITVSDWPEIKANTGEIHWVTPDGEPYVLSAANGDQNVRNGFAYGAKLPQKEVIDPQKVADQASGTKVLWSRRGNDFGCNPTGAHNIDVFLPELATLDPGTPVTLSFASSWDIEWDWDYGFVYVTTDGIDYASLPSEEGYTTSNVFDPNSQQCFQQWDNGLTGQSGAYEQGEPFVTLARNPVSPDYSTGSPFLRDSYDLSAYAGQATTVRFSYFTDAAFDRPGWFIDDLEVRAGDQVLFATDLEGGLEDGRFFNGGCGREGFNTAAICTDGWVLIDANLGDAADHAYYLELRDRAGFDFEGHGQSDRGLLEWEPGLFIEYTNENHGFGNNGIPDPPAQHYLDSQPVAGAECGDDRCNDAAFTKAEGRTTFSDSSADPHLENFSDPGRESGRWTFDFDCLTAEVLTMSGEDTEQLEADLVADVRLTAGDGCRAYNVAETGQADEDDGPTPSPGPGEDPPDRGRPLPTTGGGAALAALLMLAGAVKVGSRPS